MTDIVVGTMTGSNSLIGETLTETDFLLVSPPTSVHITLRVAVVGREFSKSHSCQGVIEHYPIDTLMKPYIPSVMLLPILNLDVLLCNIVFMLISMSIDITGT